MSRVGAYEAKTNLARLLERVERGETFTITKHGRPVAELRPVGPGERLSVDDAVVELRAFRGRHPLGDTSFRELIDEGRQR